MSTARTKKSKAQPWTDESADAAKVSTPEPAGVVKDKEAANPPVAKSEDSTNKSSTAPAPNTVRMVAENGDTADVHESEVASWKTSPRNWRVVE